MNPQRESNKPNFRVQLGHWRVDVRGRDNADAIQEARKQLCDDMPRLWDVITTMSAERFSVEPIG
jgi:hypothetical protein